MFRGCEEHHQLVRHIADKELEKAQIILHHHISEVLEHISKMRGISKLFEPTDHCLSVGGTDVSLFFAVKNFTPAHRFCFCLFSLFLFTAN